MSTTIETPTADQMNRVTKDWSRLAGEPVRCEMIGGVMHAFGTEIATRRLAHAMRSFNVGFSTNLNTWYFSNDRKGAGRAIALVEPVTKQDGLGNEIQNAINLIEVGNIPEAVLSLVDTVDDVRGKSNPYLIGKARKSKPASDYRGTTNVD